MSSRRRFIARSAGAIAGALAASKSQASETRAQPCVTDVASLCGHWLFRTDPDDRGVKNNWQAGSASGEDWRTIIVPHTWQIETPLTAYRGVAWYWRTFDRPRMTAVNGGQEHTVRVEFEAVFHSATVWVNGKLAGEHLRKGYTAFTLDITNLLRWDLGNTIAVRVDNAFNQHMVPRGQSSDWANDGGIYRPVQLLITPKTFVERVDVEAVPDLSSREAKLTINAYLRNTSATTWSGKASFRVLHDGDGESQPVLTGSANKTISVKEGGVETVTLQATLLEVRLWHFDHPHLYRLEFSIGDGRNEHTFTTNFGVRKLEIRDMRRSSSTANACASWA